MNDSVFFTDKSELFVFTKLNQIEDPLRIYDVNHKIGAHIRREDSLMLTDSVTYRTIEKSGDETTDESLE